MVAHSFAQFFWILIPLAIWDLYWKGRALWRSAKRGEVKWFIALLIINSAGILPLLYLYVFSAKKEKSNKR